MELLVRRRRDNVKDSDDVLVTGGKLGRRYGQGWLTGNA